MEKVDYDVRQHVGYVAGRRMPVDAQQVWMTAFARHLPPARPLAWLDLGSGTGRMTPALAEAFGGPAYGVEPSDKMRAQAVANAGDAAVSYAAGSAERIPLPDASVDAALLFFMWHHVGDRAAAARELRRVMKPGGTVFVQANLADAMPDIWWYKAAPEWGAADTSQFQTEAEIRSVFQTAGWAVAAHDQVTWMRSASLDEDYQKLKLRSVSAIERMTDEATDAAFVKIEAALPTLDPGPQYETSDVLIFRTPETNL